MPIAKLWLNALGDEGIDSAKENVRGLMTSLREVSMVCTGHDHELPYHFTINSAASFST